MTTSALRRAAYRLAFMSLAACLGMAGCNSSPPPSAGPAKASGTYAFWPPFPDEPHIQFLRSFSTSADVGDVKESGLDRLVFGKESSDEQGVKKPYGVEMRDGLIYVCDMRGSSLVVLDLKKKQTRLVGVTGANSLKHPVDVAVADDGTIYVADNDRGAVLVYDKGERYQTAFGHPKFKPVSVDVFGDRLYVCDVTSQSVEILDRHDGRTLGTIGAVGDEDGKFRLPLGVAVDRSGDVYVTDMMRCRIQKFSADGKLISAMGQLGDYAGTFARPKHLAVDRDGIVYVVDSAFQNVQMFDTDNHLLMHFGSAGDHPGAMDLPVGICVDSAGLELFRDLIHPGFNATGLIVVTNQFGADKVAVYAIGTRRKEFALSDMAARASKIGTGVGASAEQLKLQTVGDVEPGATDPAGTAPAETPAEAPGTKREPR